MPKHATLDCPICKRGMAIPAGMTAGKQLRCPHCQQIFSVPTEEAATRTLAQIPPATATLPPVSTCASQETVKPNADASHATLTLDGNRAAQEQSPNAAAAHKKIGRFEVRRLLGEGGFGIVYEAYDPQLDRAIALKVAKLGGDSEQRIKRFLREAKSAANLRHPHIVPLYEFGQDGDQFYLALAFIPGQSLDHVLSELNAKNERMDCRRAATLVRHLAEALAYAHGLGIVHRDIKPHNVMLDERGDPLLMDFGLAAREMDEKLTREGAIMGTAAYLAPEQYRGEPTSASDQYSLGVTLYELLTGETPFAGPPDVQIYNHVHTEPPSPRKRNPAVTRDLETICLKCLEKDAAKRYPDCRALADELRRCLDGEPILARPLGTMERLWRWCRRKPALASMTAALGTVIVIAFAVVLWQLHETTTAQQQRALAQVNALGDAAAGGVPGILADLETDRATVLPQLRARFAEESDRGKRMRLAIALLPVEPEQVRDELVAWMLQAKDPAESLLVRDALQPHSADLSRMLWQKADDPTRLRAERFRALVALASFDAGNPRWQEVAPEATEELLTANALHLGSWVQALHPVRLPLLAPLGDVFRGERLPDHSQVAAAVLADYAADQPQFLAELLMDADPKQFAVIYPKVKEQGERALTVLAGEIDKKLPPELPSSDKRRETLAKRQANAAVALLKMNQPTKVWPLLKHSADPRVRSYLIHRFGPLGADAGAIVKRLDEEPDVTIRRALILSLGEFGEREWSAGERSVLTKKLQEIYGTAADPGLHAASEWLLRSWKHEAWLKQTDDAWANDREQREKRLDGIKQMVAKEKGKTPPQWYVNGQGQTMVVIPGPLEFLMGSPPSEQSREGGAEGQAELLHKKRIRRSFAVGAKEVTVEQFLHFSNSHKYDKYARTIDCPVNMVSWYDAAAYCNWLSSQERIPEGEWCYLRNEQMKFGDGMKPAPNYLERMGYRLPTEAEWECACRAGALTSRYYGETEELLNKYGWYSANSLARSMLPAGSLKPNDWGLFNMYGNAGEWCQDPYTPSYALAAAGQSTEDSEDGSAIRSNVLRVFRGGSLLFQPGDVRSARRNNYQTPNGSRSIGFRLARTITP